MKSAITIRKGNYESMNAYTVRGSNGSALYRFKSNYKNKDLSCSDGYAVFGSINDEFVYIDCKNYRSAKELFMAMQ